MPDLMYRWLSVAGLEWSDLKRVLEPLVHVSHDALHVVVGVVLQIAVAWATRSALSRWLPWMVVFGLTLLNEYNDLQLERWPDFNVQLGEGVKDIVLTMLLPTMLLVLARRRPQLVQRGPRSK